MNARQLRAIDAFAIPGMNIGCAQPTPAPRPLVHRCECGQVISENKHRCHFCQELFYREVAEQIGEDRSLLDAVLQQTDGSAEFRKMLLDGLRPYLKFSVE